MPTQQTPSEEYFVCNQTSLGNWVIIKVLYRYFRRCLLGCMDRDWNLSLHVTERYLWALSVIQHPKKLHVTMSLVTRSCITECVKRLADNEIELGMEIPTIESRASNVSPDKGICIRDWLNPWHRGSNGKDLCGIYRKQHGHPGPAIDYWSERSLSHVYMILVMGNEAWK